MIEASREVHRAPVVVAVHDSTRALRLFRSALDEAIGRSRDLIVLDYGSTPLRDELRRDSTGVESSAQSAMRALSANPHVKLVRVDPGDGDIAKTVSYCEGAAASLLIVSADHLGQAALDDELADRLFQADFDVLVVADQPRR